MAHLRHQPMGPHMDKFHLEEIEDLTQHITLHRFTRPDFSDPHDHPWGFISVIEQGSYIEECFDPRVGYTERRHHKKGDMFYVPATHIHRIVELPDGPCFTTIRPQWDSFHQEWGKWSWVDEGEKDERGAYRSLWRGDRFEEWHRITTG